MSIFWLIATLLFLLHLIPTAPAFGIGVGIGGATGGVWIGGGGGGQEQTPPQQPQPIQPPPTTDTFSDAYNALQAWKSAITDDPNHILNSWVGPNVCNYKGIFCTNIQPYNNNDNNNNDDDNKNYMLYAVTAIDLNHANLKGVLVKQLSVITELSILHLNSNRFSGTIPTTFQNLQSLTELDLSNNQFSGPFPTTILYLSNIVYLDLRFNDFSGALPDELFNKQLDAILLNDNRFDGEIPESLGNSPASVINLANNRFSGEIPASLGYVNSRLKEILFLNNQLSGCIPEGVGLFSDMQVLDVSYNSLMGHVPDTLSCLEDIQVLNLAHNKLSGELSDVVCSLRNLVNLSVEYNFFSGFSQKCAGLFMRSVGFDFSLNCIPGKGMQRPPPDCSMIPGIGGSCPRIPSTKPLVCGSLLDLLLNLELVSRCRVGVLQGASTQPTKGN